MLGAYFQASTVEDEEFVGSSHPYHQAEPTWSSYRVAGLGLAGGVFYHQHVHNCTALQGPGHDDAGSVLRCFTAAAEGRCYMRPI